MAVITTCDGGCGATSNDGRLVPRGIGRLKHYCEKCVASIDLYLADRDVAHERICRDWQETLEKLNAGWKLNHPNGVLPDD